MSSPLQPAISGPGCIRWLRQVLYQTYERACMTGSAVPRVPDFFIVGQPRSGTTALYEMLRWHPEIFMTDPKEPLFLANDLRQRFRRSRLGLRRTRVEEYLATLPTTMDEYLALFEAATPDQQLGEASVLYLFSRSAAASIQELNPASAHHRDLS